MDKDLMIFDFWDYDEVGVEVIDKLGKEKIFLALWEEYDGD